MSPRYTNSNPKTAYDELPYHFAGQFWAHPARLAALARLHGLGAAKPEACRFVDFGCGNGLTVLALASLFPASEFLGVDLAAEHVSFAETLAREAGLSNARFLCAGFEDIDPARIGTADYAICSGVYAWMPGGAREALWEIVGKVLAPEGHFGVRYPTLPGSSHMVAVRGPVLFETNRHTDPREKIAAGRAMVGLLGEFAGHCKTPGIAELRTFLAQGDRFGGDTNFFHEWLGPHYAVFAFHEVAATASRHDLHYLTDAEQTMYPPWALGQPAARVVSLASTNRIEIEQYSDFAANRMVRTSVFSRQTGSDVPTPQWLPFLWVRSFLLPDPDAKKPGDFIKPPGQKVALEEPWILALLAAMPEGRPRPFSPAAAVVRAACIQMAGEADTRFAEGLAWLLRLVAAGLVDFCLPHTPAWAASREGGDPPLVSPLNRALARRGLPLILGDLNAANIPESLSHALTLCDGQTPRQEISLRILAAQADGTLPDRPATSPGEAEMFLARLWKKIDTLGLLEHRFPSISNGPSL